MDERIKKLFTDLGNAINESLAHSPELAGAIERLKEAGYDIWLVLEVTMAYRRNQAANPFSPEAARLTPSDAEFLKSLRISPSDPPPEKPEGGGGK